MILRPYFLLLPIVLIYGWFCAPTANATGNTPESGLEPVKIVSPDNIPGARKVDAERVIELIWELPELVLIDSRITSDRNEGFIEGSISLPNTETDCNSLAKIIPGESSPVVFFCNGVKCGRSAKAAQIAVGCGYRNIYWFRGGIEEWKQKRYPLLQ